MSLPCDHPATPANDLLARPRCSWRCLARAILTGAAGFAGTLAYAQSNYATPYLFTTLAGVTASGASDGTGTAARFFMPKGVAVDTSGNVYVGDTNNHTIRKITPAGVVTTLAGIAGVPGNASGTGTAARFNTPRGVAVDSAGNVYVADSQNYMIRKITPGGVVTTLAGGVAGSADGTGAIARFISPYGVAVDGAGNVYVADAGNNAIRKVSPVGVVTTLAGALLPTAAGNVDGTGSAARFASPFGVTVDPAGNVYVADRDNYKIRKITPAGVVTTLAGFTNGISADTDGTGSAARFATVEGVAADGSGNVYVVDSTNSSIRKVTAAGVVTTLAGLTRSVGSADGTGSVARFNSPQGIAVDSSGKVYVADTISHTIRVGQIPETSNYGIPFPIVTFAGTPSSGAADGTGNAARFFSPSAVAVDRFTNNLYVADANNHTIRKITPAGVVTTFAGTAGLSGTADGTGSAARFNAPRGIAFGPNSSNLYIADTGNHTIRKITPGGVVTTLAGGTAGALDGAGTVARFSSPWGVAVYYDDTVYVGDSGNHAIRRITPAGVVTTLAGVLGSPGSGDGIGNGARFSAPCGVVLDNTVLYVADRDNNTIRSVETFTFSSFPVIEGTVKTLVGVPGIAGSGDGFTNDAVDRSASVALTRARFNHPNGVAVDLRGNVYVADTGNSVIRRINLRNGNSDVETLAGLAGTVGSSDGSGSAARFNFPQGLVVADDYTLYVADTFNHTIRKSVALVPSFDIQPPIIQVVTLGTPRVAWTWHGVSNVPLVFDLKKNGISIPVVTNSGGKNDLIPFLDDNGFRFGINNIEGSDLTTYSLTISNASGSATSSTTLSTGAVNAGRLGNLSIRSNAGTGAQTLIVGFVVGGANTTGTKPLLIRGVGPALGAFGVTGFLVDPSMSVFSGSTVVAANDNWNGDAQITAIGAQVGAFALGAATGRDAALYNSALSPGSYTVQITGVGGTTGIALAEIYDVTSAGAFLSTTPRLVNVSARTQVGTGSDILITGFSISGATSRKLLIRAVGPTLGVFGVTGVLADPKLDLFSGASVIQTNDNWGGGADIASAAAGVGAFALDGASKDAVLLVTLQPGSYTAQVSGVGNTTGVALVEIYDVP